MKHLHKNKSFFNLLLARILINTGDSLYYVATTWTVLQWTHHSVLVGLTNTLLMIPMCISFLFGPIVDAIALRKTLIITPILQFLILLTITFLYFVGILNVYLLIILVTLAMFCAQIGYPAQSKAIPILVSNDALVKANSAMSVAYQGTDVIMNALSGIIVATLSFIPLYFGNSLIFLIAALFFMLIKWPVTQTESIYKGKYLNNLKEGFQEVYHSLLFLIAVSSSILNFGLGILYTWVPLKANYLGGSFYFGLLMSLLSLGLIVGSLLAPYIKNVNIGYGKILIFLYLSSGLLLIFINYVPNIIFMMLFPISFITISIGNVSLVSIQQKVTPEKLLARITTIITSISAMTLPLGSLSSGVLIKYLGLDYTLVLTGLIFIIGSLIFYLSKPYRSLPQIEKIEYKHIFKNH